MAAAAVLRRPPSFALASSASGFASRGISRPLLLAPDPSRSPWVGLRKQQLLLEISHSSISRHFSRRREKKGRCRGNVVYASLFGVGAPEALVIGVVALLVFGPKGLAEVARNLGKTLRAFQPTIRELQNVSREFRSTLEREIGLDDISPSTNYRPTGYLNDNQQPAMDPDGKPTNVPYSTEEILKVTEEQLAASATAAQMKASTPSEETQAASTSEAKGSSSSSVNDTSAIASNSADQKRSPDKAEGER